MEERLTAEEQAILNWIASDGRATYVRRAHLVLLRDEGIAATAIARQVNLSRAQVYNWLKAFKEKRLDIFPAELLAAAAVAGPPPVAQIPAEPPPTEEAPSEPTVEVLPSEPEQTEPEVKPPPPQQQRKSPGVLPDDSMSEAGRKVLLFHFERMLYHEPGTRLGEDIEELHDMRVASRRMRSAFRVFSRYFDADVLRPFLKGLRRTGRALGRVRDLDVFLEKAQRYRATQVGAGSSHLPPHLYEDLDPLFAEWQRQREAAREQMLACLDGKRYQRFVQEFGQFLNTEGAGALLPPAARPSPQQVYQAAPILIYERFNVVRGYDPVIGDAPLETFHALRTDCKRLRYTMEFFREVLGPEAKEVIREVVILQDHLGNLNDADVASRLLICFLDQWSKRKRRERTNISGVARYLVAKQNELHVLLDSFPEVWRHFNRPKMRRLLALAVSAL
jgi:CHAD domain-containing protein/transposase-like protein